MKIPLPKLKAMLLYFANNTNEKNLGKVKLMKLFYFCDFEHVRKYGAPITFDTYIHLEHGPIPSVIKNLVDTLCDSPEESTLADTIECEKLSRIHLIKAVEDRKLTDDDLLLFSQAELQTLREVTSRFRNSNTKSIEEEAHRDRAWLDTDMLQEIPYKYAFDGEVYNSTPDDLDLLLKIMG